MAIKARFPLLILLGIVFLASVCAKSDKENPFFFKSNNFQTLFENENGHIRLLQRFDKRSQLFENLQNYRLVEYNSKPHTLFLPQHNDADFILVVLRGNVLNPNERNSFKLERGDTIRLPAGTIAYLANRDDNEDLRVLDLAIPVNRQAQVPHQYEPCGMRSETLFFLLKLDDLILIGDVLEFYAFPVSLKTNPSFLTLE